MGKNKQTKPTIDEVNSILAVVKIAVRPMEWIAKQTKTIPQWVEYKSACQIANNIREDVFFIATYRPSGKTFIGDTIVEKAEKMTAALHIGQYRVSAIDCDDNPHTNKVGRGLPYFNQEITSRTHKHIWCQSGYGYVEPIHDIIGLGERIRVFCAEANIALPHGVKLPESYTQPNLF